jgi:hypothetical protein
MFKMKKTSFTVLGIFFIVLSFTLFSFVSADYDSGWINFRESTGYVVCGDAYAPCDLSELSVDWYNPNSGNNYEIICGESPAPTGCLLWGGAAIGRDISVPVSEGYYLFISAIYEHASTSNDETMWGGFTHVWFGSRARNVVDLGAGDKSCVFRETFLADGANKVWLQGTAGSVMPYRFKLATCIPEDSGLVYCDDGTPVVSNCGGDECFAGEFERRFIGDSDVGICEYGIEEKTCNDGYWSDWVVIEDPIGPEEEICGNDIDEDCDGYDEECSVCMDGNTRNLLENFYCDELDYRFDLSYEICYNDVWDLITNDVLVEDCSHFDQTTSGYFCVDGYNRTKNITTESGACTSSGCDIQLSTVEDLHEYCEFGCIGGICQDDGCVEGETRNEDSYDLCFGDDLWNNATYEVCTLNTWVAAFDLSFVLDCFNDSVIYGDWECIPETDNRTRDVTTYEGFCDSAACDVSEDQSEQNEYCLGGCIDGICGGQICVDGEVRNLWGVDFCSGLNVLSNVSYEQCFGNSWHPFHIFDQFKEDCSSEDILESQYCLDDDLIEVWSRPICTSGVCDRENYDMPIICEYGCAEDDCLPPTDWPICSIDYLAMPNGENIFNISDFAFNQSGDFDVWGSANANSENFLLTYVTYNRTSLGEVANYWGNADNQGYWEDWRTDQDDDFFLEGEHEVCCRVESKACDGENLCEVRYAEECLVFCIDSEAPELVIDDKYFGSPWNMTFFQWNWSGLDEGCAGFDGLYNLTVNNSNGSIVWNETNFAGTELMTYGLENNTEYTLTVETEDGAGYVAIASGSIFVLFGDNESSCVEAWSCSSWSDCDDETQTRSCTDLNSCGTEFFRPVLERDCDDDDDNGSGGSSSSTIWRRGEVNETVPTVYQSLNLRGAKTDSSLWWVWLIVILIVLATLFLVFWAFGA